MRFEKNKDGRIDNLIKEYTNAYSINANPTPTSPVLTPEGKKDENQAPKKDEEVNKKESNVIDLTSNNKEQAAEGYANDIVVSNDQLKRLINKTQDQFAKTINSESLPQMCMPTIQINDVSKEKEAKPAVAIQIQEEITASSNPRVITPDIKSNSRQTESQNQIEKSNSSGVATSINLNESTSGTQIQAANPSSSNSQATQNKQQSYTSNSASIKQSNSNSYGNDIKNKRSDHYSNYQTNQNDYTRKKRNYDDGKDYESSYHNNHSGYRKHQGKYN